MQAGRNTLMAVQHRLYSISWWFGFSVPASVIKSQNGSHHIQCIQVSRATESTRQSESEEQLKHSVVNVLFSTQYLISLFTYPSALEMMKGRFPKHTNMQVPLNIQLNRETISVQKRNRKNKISPQPAEADGCPLTPHASSGGICWVRIQFCNKCNNCLEFDNSTILKLSYRAQSIYNQYVIYARNIYIVHSPNETIQRNEA